MTTQALDKIRATADITQDDLRLLQTLSAMDVPEIEPEKVVARGEAPMVMVPTKSAGYINLRRNSDGMVRAINRNQLAERLKMRLDDGRPAWLSLQEKWTGRPRDAKLICPLAANHPDRPKMDALNLPVCEKRGKLMDANAVRRHLMKKHKDSYAAIQQAEAQLREDRRDSVQERMAEALVASLNGRPAQAAPAPAKAEAVLVEQECGVCHEVIRAAGKLGLLNKMKSHMKQHPAAKAA